ncbi:MAG: 2-hydroxyacid dehydrogenase [Paracoccaceae bacterium]
MKKLLITQRLPDRIEAAARANFDVTSRGEAQPLALEEAREALQTYDAILPTLGDHFPAEAFTAPNHRCQLLANFGVGTNHIDINAANAAGIQVTNTPGAVTDATADIAMMLILMTARRASEGETLLRAGKWQGWRPTQMLGMHIGGKTLGVIGMGRIGQAIAKRAHFGFGMEIHYFNRSAKSDLATPAKRITDLNTLLNTSDIVILAVPATAQTHHLIGADQLAQMQEHACLINVARGDVIDEAALIKALQSRQIAGAGLDVYEKEPQIPKALRDLPNTTLLPHLGTAALEIRENMGQMALDNLIAWQQGAPLLNPV